MPLPENFFARLDSSAEFCHAQKFLLLRYLDSIGLSLKFCATGFCPSFCTILEKSIFAATKELRQFMKMRQKCRVLLKSSFSLEFRIHGFFQVDVRPPEQVRKDVEQQENCPEYQEVA